MMVLHFLLILIPLVMEHLPAANPHVLIQQEVTGKVQIDMEGVEYLFDLDKTESSVTFSEGKVRFLLKNSSDTPIQINLNLTDPDLVAKGSKNYSIPEANNPNILIDLNFFNTAREVSRMNKRIIFRKGEITIETFSKNKLVMRFDGEGSGMRERGENFKISGSLNISY